MSGERVLPGLGLVGYWNAGDNTWKPGMDSNLLKLSVLANGAAKSRQTTLPASPTQGDIYIVKSGDPEGNKLAVFDNLGWVYYAPKPGWTIYVEDEGKTYQWRGSSWIEFGGTSGGGTVTPAPTYIFNSASGVLLEVDLTKMWTDTAKTTNVANDGDTIAVWESSVTGGFEATQSDATKRPTYRAGGGKPYVEFGGTDWLEFNTGDLNYADVSCHMGVKTYNGNVTLIGAPQHPTNHISPYFRWSLWKRISDEIQSRFNGTITSFFNTGIATAPKPIGFDTANGSFYLNGVGQDAFTAMTITYPNSTKVKIGANAAGGEIAQMDVYGVLVADRGLSASEITDTHNWLSGGM